MRHEDTELYDFAAKVGAELGLTPRPARFDHQRSVEIAWRGRGYSIMREWRQGGNRRKLEITPLYPDTEMGFTEWDDDRDGHVSIRGRVGCSMDRGPQAVAADIRRRLEPLYESTLAKVRAYNRVRQSADQARAGVKDALTAACPAGTVHWPDHCQSSGRAEAVIRGHGADGWVKVNSNGSQVEFDRFQVSPEVAVKLLEVAFAAGEERA